MRMTVHTHMERRCRRRPSRRCVSGETGRTVRDIGYLYLTAVVRGMKRVIAMKLTSIIIVALVGAVLLLPLGCAPDADIDVEDVVPGDVTVGMAGSTFQPSNVTITVGESVTWANDDAVIHTVVGETFSSGNIAPGATFTHTFDEPGIYEYECTIHPGMIGTVTVE